MIEIVKRGYGYTPAKYLVTCMCCGSLLRVQKDDLRPTGRVLEHYVEAAMGDILVNEYQFKCPVCKMEPVLWEDELVRCKEET